MKTKREPTGFAKTFNDAGIFEAFNKATAFLESRGFSVGPTSAGDPCGILLGDFAIAKWRNLTTNERLLLHGKMTGDFRNGPVTIAIFNDAPLNARKAIKAKAVTA